ncbi:MAG: glycosyltransferase family 39 protein, partial [Bdellovibrionales bacterium]|nr:glycosyltransferase family 39 protein [Bdellovibrionales bacterium]
RGNRLELEFNDYRPPGLAPAQIEASVCGEMATSFTASASEKAVIYLRGHCEPRLVEFEVLNPFVPSETDQRQLGAQLVSATVTSKLGFPLVSPQLVALISALIFLSSGLIWILLSGSVARGVAFAVPLLAYLLLRSQTNLELSNLFYLWLVFTAPLTGLYLSTRAWMHAGWTRAADRFDGKRDLPSILVWMAIITIVVCGGLLRFHAISFGLPNNYHPDEVPKVLAIMRMVDHGDLNPRYFLHPSLLLYSTYFMNTIFHSLLGVEGTFRETAFLAGRYVSAIAGTASLYLVFLIARRLYSGIVGLMAAGMLAIFPLHVTCSRYLKEDALLLFWILLATYCVVRAVQDDRRWLLVLAGLFGGAAFATKYSGMLTVCIVGAAPWLRSRRVLPDGRFLVATVVGLICIPLAFLICTPYSVLDAAKFLKDFNSERRHMTKGHTGAIDPWSQLWMYHFSRSIVPGIGFPATLLGMLGVGVLLWRRRIEDLYILAIILLFYLPAEYVKAKPAPQPERYIFPCLPFLAIAAAEFIRRVASSRLRGLAPLLLLIALWLPGIRTRNLSSEIDNDTRTQMAKWMINHLPAGSKIYMDWKPYSPRFWHDEFEVNYIQRARIIPKLDIRALKESGQDYLVLSSLFYGRYFTEPQSDAAIRQRFREVFARVPIVKQYAPRYGTYGFHNPTVTLFSLKERDFAQLESELAQQDRGEIEKTSNELRAQLRW